MNNQAGSMNGDWQDICTDCAVGLLALVAEVAFDDSQVSVESAELSLCVFCGLVSPWSRQRWNDVGEFFDDVSADSGTVFHPGLAIPHDLVIGTVEDNVKSVSWQLPDRAVELGKSAAFVMVTTVVDTFA